jgi:uncharacterized membrane protein YfcA
MSPSELVILGIAGLMSGTLNAVAGGGTFFSFGALLAVGLPPITANATSAVAMVPGYVASAVAYRQEVAHVWRKAILLGFASAAGATLGAVILIALGQRDLRALRALVAADGDHRLCGRTLGVTAAAGTGA